MNEGNTDVRDIINLIIGGKGQRMKVSEVAELFKVDRSVITDHIRNEASAIDSQNGTGLTCE